MQEMFLLLPVCPFSRKILASPGRMWRTGDLKDGEETDVGTRAEATEVQRRKERGAGRSTVASCFVTRPLLPPARALFSSSISILHLCATLISHFILSPLGTSCRPRTLPGSIQTMGSSGRKGLHPVGCGPVWHMGAERLKHLVAQPRP